MINFTPETVIISLNTELYQLQSKVLELTEENMILRVRIQNLTEILHPPAPAESKIELYVRRARA